MRALFVLPLSILITSGYASAALIPNGTKIDWAEYPAVVKVKRSDKDPCTATFIAPMTAITSPECADGAQELIHDDTEYLITTTDMKPDLEVALLYTKQSHSAVASTIASTEKTRYDTTQDLVVVGFGGEIFDPGFFDLMSWNIWTKRKGRPHFSRSSDTHWVTEGHSHPSNAFDLTQSGSDVGTAEGDEGAPLFIQGQLAGVLSKHKISRENRRRVVSHFRRLDDPAVGRFLESRKK